MKIISHILSLLLFFVLSKSALGQQEPHYTQFVDNMLYYNSAYAGSKDVLSIASIHRQQWVGFGGAPMTTSLGIHAPLKYKNIGLGLNVLNDRIGPINTTWLNTSLSYSLRFKKHDGRLAFGLNAGIHILNGDLTSLVKQDYTDPTLNIRYQNALEPNFGTGLFYHNKKWFVGISIPRILQVQPSPGDLVFHNKRHVYFNLGGYIQASRMVKIRPALQLNITENAPFSALGSLAFIFYDQFWLGGTYRLESNAGFFAQYQINKKFKVGYAFNLATTQLFNTNYGSHEIMLSYDLLLNKEDIYSPRFF